MIEEQQEKVKQVLTDLSNLAKAGIITKEQVLSVFGEAQIVAPPQPSEQKINLQKILYYIGGFIVLLGIVFFIAQQWGNMNQTSKTLLTLGSAVSTYSLGYYFYQKLQNKDFGHAFLVISAALFPLGIGTSLDSIGISANQSGGVSVNAAVLFLIYFVSYSVLKAAIFLPFSIIAASTLFFSFTNYLFKGVAVTSNFYEYRVLVLGISYVLLGYHFSLTERKFMTGLMYFFGLSMVLGVTLSLQRYSPRAELFWEALYPFLLVGTFWGSIKLQSKIFLIMATIFTFAEIVKITAEYFSSSIGWPISLIIAGLIIMGIGYMSFELHKRFFNIAPKVTPTA